jgi:hypothetical protein
VTVRLFIAYAYRQDYDDYDFANVIIDVTDDKISEALLVETIERLRNDVGGDNPEVILLNWQILTC